VASKVVFDRGLFMSFQNSEAIVPYLIQKYFAEQKNVAEVFAIILGIFFLSVLAQVAIPLPWTPVPITGQTFGVCLMALSWGRKRSLAVIGSYLFLGAMGAPIFAAAKSGPVFGPTLGYLGGMVCSSFFLGTCSDKGILRSWPLTLLAAFGGSTLVFTCGVIGLSFFIPTKALFVTGVLPFLPGDVLKNTLATFIACKIYQKKN